MYTIVVAGRQGGKSTTAKHQVIYWALTYPGSKIWYIMPSEGHCRGVHRDILKAIESTGLVKSKKSSSGSIEIVFTNGTILEFKSGSSNSLRGTPVNFMVIDEAGYINQNVVESDLLPSLNVAGRKVLICSTPKGKNWLYKYYMMGLDNNQKDYKSFKFLSSDNPSAQQERILLAKQRLPEAVFLQEYLAEFVEGAEVFRNIYDVCCLPVKSSTEQYAQRPVQGDQYYCGIDIGLVNDDTVITILNQRGEMVTMERFTNVTSEECLGRILRQLKYWRPVKATIEENNMGLVMYELVKKQYSSVEGFRTTNQSKEEIINRLISAFSVKSIKLFNDDEIKTQLMSFVFEMTSTGKIRYKAADGFHDDIVMSLALAYSLLFDRINTGGYFVKSNTDIQKETNKDINKKSINGFYIDEKGLNQFGRLNGEDNNEFVFFT